MEQDMKLQPDSLKIKKKSCMNCVYAGCISIPRCGHWYTCEPQSSADHQKEIPVDTANTCEFYKGFG